ncbi:hypothetical protein OG765_04385 [Streptomyces sp. NBC_00555]|uniref:hypothetical protein n=1 Tax=Streptomyces sp. NBC_00555 TaxID=2903662 RepID=UPI0022530633|nr:hypothetical protein [Streptomyces sp. NBC_00555]MCX5010227.1 hypothetical protein [Streptomyces sp. NBC_00555]
MITADPRHTSRVGLFVGILSALLFAVLHCSSPLPGDGLPPSGTASVGAAAAETASQHPAHPAHPAHHIDCLSPGLAPQAQNEPRHPADAEPALPLTPVADPPSADPAAPPGAGAARMARTGRSTLTSVCRWRI